MSEIRIVGPGETRGYPYPVCKKTRVNCMHITFYSTMEEILPVSLVFSDLNDVRDSLLEKQLQGKVSFSISMFL